MIILNFEIRAPYFCRDELIAAHVNAVVIFVIRANACWRVGAAEEASFIDYISECFKYGF